MGEIITLFVIWNIVGIIAGAVFHDTTSGAFGLSDGLEYVNPIFIYKHNRVNWFGAIIVCLIYSLICPIGTIIYWVYKLCTVGRK